MRVGIMQPYIFPYIGYFQLIAAVDTFVIHDDVQWIKGGWINRNRILIGNQAQFITIPIAKGSSSARINERRLHDDFEVQAQKILRQLEASYRKAPFFEETYALARQCLASPGDRHAALFISHTLATICDALAIKTPILISSQIPKDDALHGEARVIELNKQLGSTHYINPIGGQSLYRQAAFEQAGMTLSFIRARPTPYAQAKGMDFIPFLSILDVLMFNGLRGTQERLSDYDLLAPEN